VSGVRVLSVGKKAPGWADDGWVHYAKRLSRWTSLDEVVLKPALFRGDVEAVRADEARRLLAAVRPRERLVALDERGEDLTTEAFAELVQDGIEGGGVVFALGGPYGHGPSLRSAAWRRVRFGSMVLNHQIARLVLVEQLYRVFAIREGVPYHH